MPVEVAELIDSFEPTLGAATPLRLEADPYLTTTLWAAAFRAEKALRQEDPNQRRDVRIALEQFRHALRDITENQPYTDDAPVRDVLARTVEILSTPQRPSPTCSAFPSASCNAGWPPTAPSPRPMTPRVSAW